MIVHCIITTTHSLTYKIFYNYHYLMKIHRLIDILYIFDHGAEAGKRFLRQHDKILGSFNRFQQPGRDHKAFLGSKPHINHIRQKQDSHRHE